MYPLVKLSSRFNKPFESFNAADAKDYFKWFSEIRFLRLEILRNQVSQTGSNWNLEFSRESLQLLFNWFKKNVREKPIGLQEERERHAQLESTPLLCSAVVLRDSTLTRESVSICFDTGIYFGECLIKNIKNLEWGYLAKSKRNIEYAQPVVLSTQKKLEVSPRRIMEICTLKIIDGTSQQNEFSNLYDVWMDLFAN